TSLALRRGGCRGGGPGPLGRPHYLGGVLGYRGRRDRLRHAGAVRPGSGRAGRPRLGGDVVGFPALAAEFLVPGERVAPEHLVRLLREQLALLVLPVGGQLLQVAPGAGHLAWGGLPRAPDP